MKWRLAVLVALVCGFLLPGGASADEDLGGGVITWNTTPVKQRMRPINGRPDACVREDFSVAVKSPVFVVDAEGLKHAGPLAFAGLGGTWPCWFGDGTGWFEARTIGLNCTFVGTWVSFFDTLEVSMKGSCGTKQLTLFGALSVTGPRSAVGFLAVTD